jgi:hypothetical protein
VEVAAVVVVVVAAQRVEGLAVAVAVAAQEVAQAGDPVEVESVELEGPSPVELAARVLGQMDPVVPDLYPVGPPAFRAFVED